MKISIKVIHWLPRIICILGILVISFAALDAFKPGLTIWQQVGAYLMHLIPFFISIALLIVAWKWEFIGGIIIALSGFVVGGFFIIAGILFIVSHYQKKKSVPSTT